MTDNLTWQVVSLELAKDLRDLGVPQESLFYWEIPTSFTLSKGYNFSSSLHYSKREFTPASVYESVSAFTATELGRMLPHCFVVKGNEHTLTCDRKKLSPHSDKISHRCMYENQNWATEYSETANTEADARARMLQYLLKNDIITVNDINKKMGSS